jgi:hypothetical protein
MVAVKPYQVGIFGRPFLGCIVLVKCRTYVTSVTRFVALYIVEGRVPHRPTRTNMKTICSKALLFNLLLIGALTHQITVSNANFYQVCK